MRHRGGFTLLEVVVAGGLLAVGVLSLTMLQAQALQVQRRVAIVRQLVAVAEAELYRTLALPEPVSGECAGTEVADLTSCEIDAESCAVGCSGTASSRATRVTVFVEREGQEFVLSAIHAWFGG